MMSDYTFFSKDPGYWGESYQSLWGCHDICPLLEWFHTAHMTQSELASLTHLKAWGDAKKFYSNADFLLVLPEEGAVGERVYGLTMVWVYLYQARVSMIDDVAKQLAQLASTRPDWPYALVQLNRNAHHMPLPTEGHLSVMTKGNANNVPCGKIQQLEVHQLLSSDSWVVYPDGLNGCQVPVVTSWVTIQWHDYAWRWTNFPTCRPLPICHKGARVKGPIPWWWFKPYPSCKPFQGPSPQGRRPNQHDHGGQQLLSWAVLDTSGLASRSSTPKRRRSLAFTTSLPLKPEDSVKPVDTSSQVSIPDDMEMDDPSLEEIHASPSLQSKLWGTAVKLPP